jgi:hypothetical protein
MATLDADAIWVMGCCGRQDGRSLDLRAPCAAIVCHRRLQRRRISQLAASHQTSRLHLHRSSSLPLSLPIYARRQKRRHVDAEATEALRARRLQGPSSGAWLSSNAAPSPPVCPLSSSRTPSPSPSGGLSCIRRCTLSMLLPTGPWPSYNTSGQLALKLYVLAPIHDRATLFPRPPLAPQIFDV